MVAAALCGVAKSFAPGQDRPPRTIGRQNAAVPHFDLAILRAPAGSPTVAGPSLDVGGSSIQHVPVVAGQNNESASLARCSQYRCQLAQNLHGPKKFDLVGSGPCSLTVARPSQVVNLQDGVVAGGVQPTQGDVRHPKIRDGLAALELQRPELARLNRGLRPRDLSGRGHRYKRDDDAHDKHPFLHTRPSVNARIHQLSYNSVAPISNLKHCTSQHHVAELAASKFEGLKETGYAEGQNVAVTMIGCRRLQLISFAAM